MNTSRFFALSFTALSLSIVGCAANTDSSTNAPAPKDDAVAAAPTLSGGAGAAKAPSAPARAAVASSDRGTLLGTVMASAKTTTSTSISVWATYKQDGRVTTVGYDQDGNVKSELVLSRVGGSRDVDVTAPGMGSLRIHEDGTILSNAFSPDKLALSAMHSDFDAGTKDAAYGWVSWVLTFVSCAAAGFEAGLNPVADAACVAGGIDLMME